MTTRYRIPALALILAAIGSTCTGEGGGAAHGDTRQSAAVDSGAPMGAMGDGGIMEAMQAHLLSLDGVSADSLRAAMPAHRQLVASMVARMNREMREMNMAGDAAWTATIDSVRQDLVHLPEMSSEELSGFMPAHRVRIRQLLDSHRAMMGNMKR